jgi:hypothetical protein
MAFQTSNFDLALTKLATGCSVAYTGGFRASFEELARTIAGSAKISYSSHGIEIRVTDTKTLNWHPTRA